MSEDSRRHRISLSRKIFGGKVFVNESVEFNDPTDPEEVKQVIAELQSPGYTTIIEALADRLDEDGEAEVARVRGERRDRIGLKPLEKPKRTKTAAPIPAEPTGHDVNGTRLSTIGQRSQIRDIISKEVPDAEGNTPKRNYLNAILKREKIDNIDDISFAGAAQVLSHIADQGGFQPARELAPREGATSEEEADAMRDAATHDHNLDAIKEADAEEKQQYTNLVEGADGGDA